MKAWLLKNKSRLIMTLAAAARAGMKAGLRAWKLGGKTGIILALGLGLAGCVTHNFERTEYATDADGKQVVKAVTRGTTDVEMEAVKAQGRTAQALADKADLLKTSLKVPVMMLIDGRMQSLTDSRGNVVYIEASSMDSGVAATIGRAADTTAHDSQGVKMAKTGVNAIGQAVPYVTIGVVAGDKDGGTGNNNSTNYDNSFNNANQSPTTVDNIAANVEGAATDSHASTTTTNEAAK